MWCWTDGCLLSRLQRRGNVVSAWIVVIAHWTTVSLSTASRLSRRLCRRLCLLYCPGVVPACFRQVLHTWLKPYLYLYLMLVGCRAGQLKTLVSLQCLSSLFLNALIVGTYMTSCGCLFHLLMTCSEKNFVWLLFCMFAWTVSINVLWVRWWHLTAENIYSSPYVLFH